MSGLTPGPWDVNDARTVEGLFMVCAGQGHEYGVVAEVLTEDDARLIASLPALVAERDALRKALEAVQWAGRDRFRCIECGGQPSTGHSGTCRVGLALSPAAHQREGAK